MTYHQKLLLLIERVKAEIADPNTDRLKAIRLVKLKHLLIEADNQAFDCEL